MTEPPLIFEELPLRALIRRWVRQDTLIVTDPYNFPYIRDLGKVICVSDQDIHHIESIGRTYTFESVIAVGGCTVLDFGRACARGKDLTVIPTILSNACLSTNRSVINRDGFYCSEITTLPSRTIVSVPTIEQNHADEIKKWSASGLGDLFSGFSAAIEFEWAKRGHSFENIKTQDIDHDIPTCVAALDWVVNRLNKFDRDALIALAGFLHETSLDVVRNGHTELNAGSEHWLYYKMQERQKYPKMIATHGRLVSIGTLLTAKIFARESGVIEPYSTLRHAYRKIGLPLTYSDLEQIGVERSAVLAGISDLQGRQCLYSSYSMSDTEDSLDAVYGTT